MWLPFAPEVDSVDPRISIVRNSEERFETEGI
jgi:hypothetical protein